ncbi:MAG: hypothetical protein JO027_07595 [Solirubrobacterales bacterium]|nr:hypothetical protein [Solirubrobacterales bacterium]
MNTYRLRLAADPRYRTPYGIPAIEADALAELVGGVAIRELTALEWGHWMLDVALARASHEQALDELVGAAAQLGFSYVNATVSEWADRAAEGALFGALGGGGVGVTATRDPELTAVASLFGILVGGWVGSRLQRVEVQFEARRLSVGGWQLIPLIVPSTPGRQPGFAAG